MTDRFGSGWPHHCGNCGRGYRESHAADVCCAQLVADGGHLEVCPDCDATNIKRRLGSMTGPDPTSGDVDAEYYCTRCGATFDEPTVREPHCDRPAGAGSPLATRLVEADPDDLVTDGGRELVEACPACDSASLHRNNGGMSGHPDAAAYHCKECYHAFDEPTLRERRTNQGHNVGGLSAAGRTLVEADPDADLVTDGGEQACGRHSCDRTDTVAVSNGAGKVVRCELHALETVDGVGRKGAKRLLEAYEDLPALVAACDAYAATSTGPARIARLDGFGPSRAGTVSTAIAETFSHVGAELVTDGGRREWRCSSCGDSVAVEYLEDGVCVGCKYGGRQRVVTDGGRPIPDGGRIAVDDLTDEQIERVLNSRGFQKMLAYNKLADGIDVLEEEDEIYDSMITTITKQHSSVSTETSVREVLELFRQEIATFTEPLVDEDGEESIESTDLEDLYVDDGGAR